jgi:hypothetical protein
MSVKLSHIKGLVVFENEVLRKISVSERDEVSENWMNCFMRSLRICTFHQILLSCHFKKDVLDGHVACKRYMEMKSKFWLENCIGHLEDLSIDGKIKLVLKEHDSFSSG